MDWLKDIERTSKRCGDPCDNCRDMKKLIAAVRLAERVLNRITLQPGTLVNTQGWAWNAVLRLRSGDVEDK